MNNTSRDCKSKVNITGLPGDLGTNKQHCNHLKCNYFWDCDGIDNVMLRLWKFSDFCSRHTVGVAGDDIMVHILVVCVCICLPMFMKDWCHTNNILQVHCWGCLVVQVMFHSRTHDVIGDVTRSQSMSNFEIVISPSIFELELECRSKAQNVTNAHGYLSGIFNFRYNIR